MTATALAQGETVTCIHCEGAGELVVPHLIDPQTGTAITRTCTSCAGDGVVEADRVATCTDGCHAAYWAGEGCEHDKDLCGACRPLCRECASDAAEQVAFDYARERDVLAGGGWS